jgi:predicted ABC-type ATPase
MAETPVVIVLGGSNGSGKTTASRLLLADTLKLMTFVNADVIAQGLAGFNPEAVAFEASRIMLERLRALAAERASFAFETTLAGRSYVPWLEGLRAAGYWVHLVYFWVESADMAVERVGIRVQSGGHRVPEETVRRRYRSSVRNFLSLYWPVVSFWEAYDNSSAGGHQLLASGEFSGEELIADARTWERLQREGRNE